MSASFPGPSSSGSGHLCAVAAPHRNPARQRRLRLFEDVRIAAEHPATLDQVQLLCSLPSAARHRMADICIDCGLCCNGALFGHFEVTEKEVGALNRAQVRVVEREGRITGCQPCAALTRQGCSIYQQRPAVCATYRCDLLVRLESGAVSTADALRTVAEAVRLQSALQLEMAQLGKSGRTQMRERVASADGRAEFAPILIKQAALEVLFRRAFGRSPPAPHGVSLPAAEDS